MVSGTLSPKLGLGVMECEVSRIYIAASDVKGSSTGAAIIPVHINVGRRVGFCVPAVTQLGRQTYRDFHQDLFPDTRLNLPLLSAEEYAAHVSVMSRPVLKTSLNPEQRVDAQTVREHLNLPEGIRLLPNPNDHVPRGTAATVRHFPLTPGIAEDPSHVAAVSDAAPHMPSEVPHPLLHLRVAAEARFVTVSLKSAARQSAPAAGSASKAPLASTDVSKRTSAPVNDPLESKPKFSTGMTSKFKFISSKPSHPSEWYTNLSGLSFSVPPEGSTFEARLPLRTYLDEKLDVRHLHGLSHERTRREAGDPPPHKERSAPGTDPQCPPCSGADRLCLGPLCFSAFVHSGRGRVRTTVGVPRCWADGRSGAIVAQMDW